MLLHSANRNGASINIQSQRQQQQRQQPSAEVTTKIHIVFSTGCNAFQDCKSPAISFLFDLKSIQTL
jgi:hypothetical protein